MSHTKTTIFAAIAVSISLTASAARPLEAVADSITGELLLADPTVITLEGKYYMAGTQPGKPPGFTVFESDDLLHWRSTSPDGISQLSPGERVFGTKGFWAPQFILTDDKVHLFYTANEQVACASADSITGKYSSESEDVQPIDPSCGNIDPFLFRDTDGKCYLYHVRFDNGNYIWVGEFDMEKGKIMEGSLRPTFRVD